MKAFGRKKISSLAFAWLGLNIVLMGQETGSLVQEFIYTYQKGTISASLTQQLCQQADSDMLGILHRYCSDKNDRIREAAWYLTAAIGRGSNNPAIRKDIFVHLVQSCSDPNPWISEKNIIQLRNFERSFFDQPVKKTLENIFRNKAKPSENLIKIIGFSDCRDLIPALKNKTKEYGSNEPNLQWACHLAMARMGDPEAIRYCMKKIRKLPVNDATIEDVFPDLIYMRQKTGFDYLLEIALDASLHCSSYDPDNERNMPCTAKILEIAAPYLKNFPLQEDEFLSMPPEEIVTLTSNWIKEKYNADAIRYDIY